MPITTAPVSSRSAPNDSLARDISGLTRHRRHDGLDADGMAAWERGVCRRGRPGERTALHTGCAHLRAKGVPERFQHAGGGVERSAGAQPL